MSILVEMTKVIWGTIERVGIAFATGQPPKKETERELSDDPPPTPRNKS